MQSALSVGDFLAATFCDLPKSLKFRCRFIGSRFTRWSNIFRRLTRPLLSVLTVSVNARHPGSICAFRCSCVAQWRYGLPVLMVLGMAGLMPAAALPWALAWIVAKAVCQLYNLTFIHLYLGTYDVWIISEMFCYYDDVRPRWNLALNAICCERWLSVEADCVLQLQTCRFFWTNSTKVSSRSLLSCKSLTKPLRFLHRRSLFAIMIICTGCDKKISAIAWNFRAKFYQHM